MNDFTKRPPPDRERRDWMARAGNTGVAADAWSAFKKAQFSTERLPPAPKHFPTISTRGATRVVRESAVACLVLALSGCALAPNTVTPLVEHVSHLSQHEPFTSHPTEYFYNQIAVAAKWGHATGPFVELQEGYNWGERNTGGQACAGLYGPREVFTGRVGWTFQVKP